MEIDKKGAAQDSFIATRTLMLHYFLIFPISLFLHFCLNNAIQFLSISLPTPSVLPTLTNQSLFCMLVNRNLSHKNLVKLLGVSLDGNPIYIVTEFCGKVSR